MTTNTLRTRTSSQAGLLGVAIILLTGFCFGQAPASPADWTQYHRNNMERFNPFETVLDVNNVGNLKLKWSYDTSAFNETSAPTVANGVVYVGGYTDGKVYAINASTGRKLWTYDTGGCSCSPAAGVPAVANGVVYVAGAYNQLFAINAKTGALLWRYTFQGFTGMPVAVANGIVYVSSARINKADHQNAVYALNATTGALLWSHSTVDAAPSAPAVKSGVVYVGLYFPGHGVIALDAKTGVRLWHRILDISSGSPAVANGVVYVDGMTEGKVYAVKTANGNHLWNFDTEEFGDSISDAAVANGVVYVTGAYNVYALDAKSGTVLWTFPNGNAYKGSAPAVANGVVYIGLAALTSNSLYALNASTGAQLWTHTVGSSGPCTLSVVDGVLYVGGSFDGTVYAFGLN